MVTVQRNARTGVVAAALGVAPATVQHYARSGRIPYRLTPGKQYRFNLDEVMEVLGRGPLISAEELPSVFGGSGVLVDGLSAYRADPVDAATEARQRARGVRTTAAPARTGALSAADGAAQFSELVRSSRGAAVAVLHR